jgi:hypothetical protein
MGRSPTAPYGIPITLQMVVLLVGIRSLFIVLSSCLTKLDRVCTVGSLYSRVGWRDLKLSHEFLIDTVLLLQRVSLETFLNFF